MSRKLLAEWLDDQRASEEKVQRRPFIMKHNKEKGLVLTKSELK